MSTHRVAIRYATAILEALPETLSMEQLLSDVRDLRSSILASRELRLFFESPVISRENKRAGVDALFADKLSDYTVGVLRLLVEKGREVLVLDILDAVIALHREREGIVASSISSAVELDSAQRTRLEAMLAERSGKRVEAEYHIDPSLIGGLTVRLGDTVYDGSVRRQLQRLRTRFITGT